MDNRVRMFFALTQVKFVMNLHDDNLAFFTRFMFRIQKLQKFVIKQKRKNVIAILR